MQIVGIFCGGYSSEYDISVLSATTILNHLDRSKYEPYLIYVTRNSWTIDYNGEKLEVSPIDFSFTSSIEGEKKINIAHVYIHGNPGENGKLQAYLEMKEMPFINSGSLASQLSFDKWFCNQFIKGFGIDVAESILLRTKNQVHPKEIVKKLGLPLFVKPSDSGSSFGISKVYEDKDLEAAITAAFKEGKTVICEAFMEGTEVTCGVYRNEKGIQTLPCTEIVSETDFFDYEAKYLGKSQEITPARISKESTQQIQAITTQVYNLLQLRSLARVDFIIINGVPHIIEVNTTPGFSPESIAPKMLKAANISITDFWNEIYSFELAHLQ